MGKSRDPHVTEQAGHSGLELIPDNQAMPKPSAKAKPCEASKLIPLSLEREHFQ